MGIYDQFHAIRDAATAADSCISNHAALNLPENAPGVHILWMYPDILEMHGCRGDMMALLQFAIKMKLPCTIEKCRKPADEIPFDRAQLLYFPAGDLSCMPDLSRKLLPRKAEFEKAAKAGKIMMAIGSTGAVFAQALHLADGSCAPGLGLLQMECSQRERTHGDDLWFRLPDGQRIMGGQVQLADVKLLPGQEPFGTTLYGRGNCGDGTEGARTGSVIFTHTIGPMFVRNPRYACQLLLECAALAGLDPNAYSMKPEDIALELGALEDIEKFVESKMSKSK